MDIKANGGYAYFTLFCVIYTIASFIIEIIGWFK
jgi:hypothetical protein